MDSSKIEHLIYDAEPKEVIEFASTCEDPQELHVLAVNYNWSDGFKVPAAIAKNPNCSLSTALRLFYDGDGYAYLIDKNDEEALPAWKRFIKSLYKNILAGKYPAAPIAFEPQLTKVQAFKLKKFLSPKEQIFLTVVEGEDCDIEL
ncbi:MAG: DUF4274 domain-containing protein [Erysipelotrichaceae bacterium]|nr:DUF4274 domain-containing protein [Erysipelotrichaceae bacterium]